MILEKEWMSAKDVLPVDGKRVLICQEIFNQYSFNYHIQIAKRNNGYWEDDSIYSHEIDSLTEWDRIVFWCDLPEFPRGEKK